MLHLPLHIHKTLDSKKKLSNFDRLIITVSFLYPLSGLPQAIGVFAGNTAGVSMLSWFIFLCCSSLFLTYGIRHRVTPMIISNTLWVFVDSLVVIGLLWHLV